MKTYRISLRVLRTSHTNTLMNEFEGNTTAANELRDFCMLPTGITSEGRGNTRVYVSLRNKAR